MPMSISNDQRTIRNLVITVNPCKSRGRHHLSTALLLLNGKYIIHVVIGRLTNTAHLILFNETVMAD